MPIKIPWQRQVVEFWFSELTPADWFVRNDAVDKTIRQRFAECYATLAASEAERTWTSGEEALALVIVLDQFPRNLFRGSPKAFASDHLALEVSRHAIAEGLDAQLNQRERQFLYLPFMHSESAADQKRCIELFSGLGNASALDFARRHKAIIDRFGRYPHRNADLGRNSTDEELAFLKTPGSSF